MADNPVVHYYETHPINEDQIMARLNAAGLDRDRLTEEVLKEHDQDHFGGLEAVDQLADAAEINEESHVLDVCCGLGGPARHLASTRGCRVTGLDLTPSRVEGARRLTALVNLDHLVHVQHGDALAMPFPDAAFDALISEEAFCHVPDKPRLIAECARVVRPGTRIAFSDILRQDGLSAEAEARLTREMTFNALGSAEGYRALLEANGCEVLRIDDLGPLWTRILKDRLAMYRSLEDTTTGKFGRDHFERWDGAYAFFVGLFDDHQLSGARIVARRRDG